MKTELKLAICRNKSSSKIVYSGNNNQLKNDQILIEGIVLDKKSKTPISNALILLSNSEIGTETDSSGNFQLKANSGKYSIQFFKAGYKKYSTREITIKSMQHIKIEILIIEESL